MSALDTAGATAVAAARLAVRSVGRIGQTLLATDGRDVLINDPDGWEVEQPGLWWLGPQGSNGTGGPWGNPIPGASDGYWRAATGIPAVGRATSLIVDTLATLPWRVLRGQERLTTPDWLSDPQALRLDKRVINPGDVGGARWSRVDVWAQWITSALWFGDGYVWVPSRDESGQPKPPLYVLAPSMVKIEEGRYYVELADGPRELRPDEVIHLRGLEPIHRQHGSGALSRYDLALRAVGDLRSYMSSVFSAGVPAGYLKANQPRLDEAQAKDLKRSWMDAHGHASRSIAVLNATTEFHPLTFKPVDADLVAMLGWSLVDVANAFGVPSYMLGAQGDGNTYANVESRMIEFVRFTLQPWAGRIEAVMDAQFPRGTSVKIALDALMRADTATRYAAYKTAREAGWLTIDEIRALEDLPPMAEVEPDPEPQPIPVEAAPNV